jgi:hypothetical protein
VKTAALSVVRARVKFKPVAGAFYWLYYGNAYAHAPSYDLRDQLAREGPLPEASVLPGAEERNSAYQDKPAPAKPWSEQHPGVLYGTLAVAVVSMGFITVRFLKKAAATSR